VAATVKYCTLFGSLVDFPFTMRPAAVAVFSSI